MKFLFRIFPAPSSLLCFTPFHPPVFPHPHYCDPVALFLSPLYPSLPLALPPSLNFTYMAERPGRLFLDHTSVPLSPPSPLSPNSSASIPALFSSS